MPQANEYNYREDNGFESVLYQDLPNDSLEIRYHPEKSIPFKLNLPYGVDPQSIVLGGVVSLQNQKDENWIRPLDLLQLYNGTLDFVEWEKSEGIDQPQIELEKKFFVNVFDIDLNDELEQIVKDLNDGNLHPQQKVILMMSYASILGWMDHMARFLHMRNEQEPPEFNPDKKILDSIPEIVPATHPAWRYNNGAAVYLLTETEDSHRFLNYFYEVVKHHPDARAVQTISADIIRHFGSDYTSLEEMPVYKMILDRYGENDIARNAHMAFDFSRLED